MPLSPTGHKAQRLLRQWLLSPQDKSLLHLHRKRYSTLLNPVPLYVSDKDLTGLDFQLAYFTLENPGDCRRIAEDMAAGAPFGGKRTLGPYFRSMK